MQPHFHVRTLEDLELPVTALTMEMSQPFGQVIQKRATGVIPDLKEMANTNGGSTRA